jgi:hypothetical protein
MVGLSGTNPSVVASAPPARSIWMVSPAFDLLFFVCSTLIVFLPWMAHDYFGVAPGLILLAVGGVSNGPHIVSTWTRVYLDGNERWQRPITYYAMPILFSAFVIYIIATVGKNSVVLRSVVFYWASWHFVAQNWGILRIYQRRSGDAELHIAKLERVILYLGALWPILWRVFHGPHELFGTDIWHPAVPAWLVHGVGAALVTAFIAYAAYRVRQRLRGESVDFVRPLFLVCSFIGFFVPFYCITSAGSVSFSAAAAWHGLQYIAIVYVFNRRRWADGVDDKARVVSWVSQKGRGAVYYLSLLGIGAIVYGAVFLLSLAMSWDLTLSVPATWLSLTLSHYYIDGVIWKLRRPQLARHLVSPA